MERILIVEDDASNNQMLKDYLESHGYACSQAYSGSEGKLLFSLEKYDLVLLDLMLPGIPGEELVALFSEKAPVIVLSAKSGLDSKVEVLSAGAEDYLCKPFDLPELLVRIQVRLRRHRPTEGDSAAEAQDEVASEQERYGTVQDIAKSGPGGNISAQSKAMSGPGGNISAQSKAVSGLGRDISVQGKAASVYEDAVFENGKAVSGQDRDISRQGEDFAESGMAFPIGKTYKYRDWSLTPDTQEMTACGEPVELTRHEFLIMELLIRNPRRVFTKQMIYEYAWGEEYLAEDKTINVHISNIRAKLKKSGTDAYIQTVWGMGFKLS